MKRLKFAFALLPFMLLIFGGCKGELDDYTARESYLSLSGDVNSSKNIFFESGCSTKTIFINSHNDGWNIKYQNNKDSLWLKANTYSGNGNDSVKFTVSNFKKYPQEIRSAELYLTIGNDSFPISVSQESLDIYINVSPDQIPLDKDANETSLITIESNTEWGSSYKEWQTDDSRNFYRLEPINGKIDDNKATFRVLQTNVSKHVLRDTIYFYPNGYDNFPELVRSVEIVLPPKPNINIYIPGQRPDKPIYFESGGGSIEVCVTCNVDWIRPQKMDWIDFRYREDDRDPTKTWMTIIVSGNTSEEGMTPEVREKEIRINVEHPYDDLSKSINEST